MSLTVEQRIEICRELHAAKRDSLAAGLKAAGADMDTIARELRDFERFRDDPDELLHYALSLPGALRILRDAGELNGEVPKLGRAMLFRAAELVGFDLERLKAVQEEPAEDPLSSLSPSRETG